MKQTANETSTNNAGFQRLRIRYLMAILIVMLSGLFSRALAPSLPGCINIYLGDALWALMIFLIVSFIFKNANTSKNALFSLAFCYLIEISQLFHPLWLVQIRSTLIGGLILGFGFLWTDIVAYALGIAFGLVFEIIFRRKLGSLL